MPMSALARALRSTALLLLAGCGGDAPTDPITPPTGAVYAATATGGASQSKEINSASDVMTVKVTKDGVPLANASVAWTTTAGALASSTSTTNATGEATNTLSSVGATAGTVTVTASSNGKSATFTVTVTATAGPPASLSYPARIVALDSAGTAPAPATVKDANGTPLSGQTISYTSRSTAVATVNSSTGLITGVKSGTAIIVATFTSGSTTLTDSLVAVVGTPGGPVVLADLPRLDFKTDTTFTVAIVADMRTSTTKLGSGKVTVTWNASQLIYQSNSEGAQNVGASVNATGASTGTVVLAFASSAGWSGKVELRKLTFKAASAAAITGTVTATANEAYTASTYADLLSKTISTALPIVTR
jgi:adhesin/invasin